MKHFYCDYQNNYKLTGEQFKCEQVKTHFPLVYKSETIENFVVVSNLIDNEIKYLFHTVDDNIKQHYRRCTLDISRIQSK